MGGSKAVKKNEQMYMHKAMPLQSSLGLLVLKLDFTTTPTPLQGVTLTRLCLLKVLLTTVALY